MVLGIKEVHYVNRSLSTSFVGCQVLCAIWYGKYLICFASLHIFEDIFPCLLYVVLNSSVLHITPIEGDGLHRV